MLQKIYSFCLLWISVPPTYDEAERLDKKPNVQKVSSPVGGQDNVIIEEEAEAQMNAA